MTGWQVALTIVAAGPIVLGGSFLPSAIFGERRQARRSRGGERW